MKPHFSLILLLITINITGCLNYMQEVILYPDGSGEMHIDYWMKLPDEESKNVAEKIGIFNLLFIVIALLFFSLKELGTS